MQPVGRASRLVDAVDADGSLPSGTRRRPRLGETPRGPRPRRERGAGPRHTLSTALRPARRQGGARRCGCSAASTRTRGGAAAWSSRRAARLPLPAGGGQQAGPTHQALPAVRVRERGRGRGRRRPGHRERARSLRPSSGRPKFTSACSVVLMVAAKPASIYEH
eukprot:scaffold742_cov395-Prasinococcus_capsulatus_cf.AAC.25